MSARGAARALQRQNAFIKKRVIAFRGADENRDQELSFDEWYRMLPKQTKVINTEVELRERYGMLDTDGNGVITWDEYFLWSLQEAVQRSGLGMSSIFKKYDGNRNGLLERDEFEAAAIELGIGDRANVVFEQLSRRSGRANVVDYVALMADARAITSRDPNVKAFMLALMLDENAEDGGGLDTSSWEGFSAVDCASFRTELTTLLQRHEASLAEIFRVVDADGGGTINQSEFEAMFLVKLGYRGPLAVLHAVYDQIDADANGISYDEWEGWYDGTVSVSANQQIVAEARRLAKAMADGEGGDQGKPWSGERLLEMLRAVITERFRDVASLMRSWDADGSGELDKREFLDNVRRLILNAVEEASGEHDLIYYRVKLGLPVAKRDAAAARKLLQAQQMSLMLWELKIKPSAVAAFQQLDSSGDGSIGIDELVPWLQGSWTRKPPPHAPPKRRSPPPQPEGSGSLEVTTGASSSSSSSSPLRSSRTGQLSPIRRTHWRSSPRSPHSSHPPARPPPPPPRYCSKHSLWIEKELLTQPRERASPRDLTLQPQAATHRWLRPIPPQATHAQLVSLLRAARRTRTAGS